MLSRKFIPLVLVVVGIVAQSAAGQTSSPSVDGLLAQQINSAPLSLTRVVITFRRKPTAADLLSLKSLGIRGGTVLRELPIVLTAINRTQFAALRNRSNVASLYANRTFKLFNHKSRVFIGVDALQRDQEVTRQLGGVPASGQGVGIAYVDTGIDATHPDLQLGKNVVQNVIFPAAELTASDLPPDFLPPVAVEDQPFTDAEGGHGTFGAGVAAGTGQASGALYGGMAPGAKLVGLVAGNDVGLTTFGIVQAYDYALVNQWRYNIRICNNSFGDVLANYPYDPFDPINSSTREMHDRNIVVVFAAGNGIDSVGDVPGAINPFSVAPWVISVAAGEKQGLGTPTDFSSRGENNGTGTDIAGQPADPLAPANLRPDITGSGADIKSTRSKGPGITNVAGTIPIFVGANDLSTIPPAFLPFYTTSRGTSFSTPQVSGVVALMLQANPVLTPDQVVTILRQTANPMPYEERVVGAGYVDAHNAVRIAMQLSAVPHPANLFPQLGGPEIRDGADDQFGTTAQDIREGDFEYDAASNQLVYTLTLSDLSVSTPNMTWTMFSRLGSKEVFVSAAVEELGTTFEYGTIESPAPNVRNFSEIGPADSGEIRGNQIIIRLSLDKINAAVGSNVLNTTSTGTAAQAQILIGSSLVGGAFLTADEAIGADFPVGEEAVPTPTPTPTPDPTPTPTPTPDPTPTPTPDPTPTPTPDPTPTPTPDPTPTPAPSPTPANEPNKFTERYAGVISPSSASQDIVFSLRSSTLEAMLNQNHGNEELGFQLIDPHGRVVASGSSKGEKVTLKGLALGTYVYRVYGGVSRAVDFTIKSTQGK